MAEQSRPERQRTPRDDDSGLRPAPGVDRIGDALAPGAVPGGATLPGTEDGHFDPESAADRGETRPPGSDTNDKEEQGHETA